MRERQAGTRVDGSIVVRYPFPKDYSSTMHSSDLILGMAMRLSYDLGLHIDVKAHIETGRLSIEDAKSRKAAFWGSLVIDR